MPTSRKIDPSMPPKLQRQIRALSDGATYAYGFSDEKPGKFYWIVQVIVLLGALASIFWVR